MAVYLLTIVFLGNYSAFVCCIMKLAVLDRK